MAQIFGGESKYLVRNVFKFRSFALIGIFVLFLIGFMIITNFSTVSISASTVILIAILLVSRFTNASINMGGKFHQGRKGEFEIGCELRKLPDHYVVFLDVQFPSKGGNIDAVIIGPTGIFSVEAKSHAGEIMFDGKALLRDGKNFEKDILNQTMGNALALREYLKEKTGKEYFVEPVLVFSNKYAKLRFGLKKQRNVSIIRKEFLKEVILKGSPVLSPNDVNVLCDELRKLVIT